jgi:hypothetical protein
MNAHYVGTGKVFRFPRFSDDVEAKLDVLVVEGWTCYDRSHQANVDLGRVLRRIKKIVGHGSWENYYALKFPHCVSVRTARRYMRLAKKEDAKRESAKLTDFKTGTHAIAQKVDAASARAEAEAGPKKFHIAIAVPADHQDAVRKFQRTPDWLKAEEEIVALLIRYTRPSEVSNADCAA